jgi:Holliday junction DNA helicase RuvA
VIASVEGVVGAVAADSLVIEVGGIGYRVFAAPAVLASAQPGGRLKLHTFHLVREDQQALYGFRSTEELGFFTLLLTVNGVGPKVALAIVSGSRPAELRRAIVREDLARFQAIPGIGKKTAERIVLELKEKVVTDGDASAPTDLTARDALVELGYNVVDAERALAEVDQELPIEEQVRAALRQAA